MQELNVRVIPAGQASTRLAGKSIFVNVTDWSAGIVRRSTIMGGSPTIAGTRIRVSDIVRHQRDRGKSISSIRRAFPHLTTGQVKSALDHYEKNRKEIDQEIKAEAARATKWRKQGSI